MTPLRVSSSSSPHRVADAVVAGCRDGAVFSLQMIGAAAVNQAVKSVAIARQLPSGGDLVVLPSFLTLEIDGKAVTGILFEVCRRPGPPRP